MSDAVERAREAFSRQEWSTAYSLLEGHEPLGGDDLELLAVAAYLIGRDTESDRAWERAHLERARAGDHDGAARCAACPPAILISRL